MTKLRDHHKRLMRHYGTTVNQKVHCVHLGVEDALWLQTELLAVVWLVHHLLQSQNLESTHCRLVPPEDTNLQLSRLSAM